MGCSSAQIARHNYVPNLDRDMGRRACAWAMIFFWIVTITEPDIDSVNEAKVRTPLVSEAMW